MFATLHLLLGALLLLQISTNRHLLGATASLIDDGNRDGVFVNGRDAAVTITGRVHYPTPSPDSAVEYDWPCVSLGLSFTGSSSVAIELNVGNANRYQVEVDGELTETFDTWAWFSQAQHWFTVAENMSLDDVHTIRIHKLTEVRKHVVLAPQRPLSLFIDSSI